MSGQSVPYIGSKISLISKAEIRYEGILYTIDQKESTVSLAKVKSYGTEDRPTDRPVAAQDNLFQYIIFRGADIKDLFVCEGPKQDTFLPSGVPQDPAIVRSAAKVDNDDRLPNLSLASVQPPVSSSVSHLSAQPFKLDSEPLMQPERQQPRGFQTGMTDALSASADLTMEERYSLYSQYEQNAGSKFADRKFSPLTEPQTVRDALRLLNETSVLDTSGKVPPFQENSQTSVQSKSFPPDYSSSSLQSAQNNEENRSYNLPSTRESADGSDIRSVRGNHAARYHLSARRGQPLTRGGTYYRGSSEKRPVNRDDSGAWRASPRAGFRGSRRGKFNFRSEFDFEKANELFEKDELASNLKKLNFSEHGSVNEEETTVVSQDTEDTEFYNPQNSFFDNISSDIKDREEGTNPRHNWRAERKQNHETFGPITPGRRPRRGNYDMRGNSYNRGWTDSRGGYYRGPSRGEFRGRGYQTGERGRYRGAKEMRSTPQAQEA